MAKKYKKFPADPISGKVPEGIYRPEDNAGIPNNPDNIDWQEYLAWIEEGNTPDSAETEEEETEEEEAEEEE